MDTHDANQDAAAAAGTLFNLGEPLASKPAAEQDPRQRPAPRLREAERQQGRWRMVILDLMLPAEHQARVVWDYVSRLDLSPLLEKIQAVEGKPGRDSTDPRIALALWLYATLDGVGSARQVERLCEHHMAYLWLCGEVTLNYHLLADFRVEHGAFLDRLLTQSVAVLRKEGLVDMERVAQDGMRVRASAGAASMRGRDKLQECLKEAQEQVTRLRQELDADGAAGSKRQRAAQRRAAEERLERVRQALEELQKVEEARLARDKNDKGKARASTTDPEARKMKMPDGGFRVAYNAQFATDTDSRLVVGVAVTNSGSDGGQMGPMVEQIVERHDKAPHEYLVDGGFTARDDIDQVATKHQVTVYAPIREKEKKEKAGKDPFAPQPGDTEAVKEWRRRMGTEAAQNLYHLRAATAEWTNAQARNRGLYQVRVRGLAKVKAVLLLYALAQNLMQARALRAKATAEQAQKAP